MQVGLTDLLREEYGIVPAGFVGHSAGEVACAYADGGLTREQASAAPCGSPLKGCGKVTKWVNSTSCSALFQDAGCSLPHILYCPGCSRPVMHKAFNQQIAVMYGR